MEDFHKNHAKEFSIFKNFHFLTCKVALMDIFHDLRE